MKIKSIDTMFLIIEDIGALFHKCAVLVITNMHANANYCILIFVVLVNTLIHE